MGERIKALRTEQGMTLAELGEKANLSTSYLSQIERDKTTPSLPTLTSIARALNVGLRYFFEVEAEAAYIVRAAEQNGLVPNSLLVRQGLTPEGNPKIQACRFVLQPHALSEQFEPYPGEEFVYVLTGALTIAVGEEQFTLSAGDSVHYDAFQPHQWSNKGDEPCIAIWSRSSS